MEHDAVEPENALAAADPAAISFESLPAIDLVLLSPLSDFERAVREAGLEARVRYLARGETYGFVVPARRWTRRGARATVPAD